MKRIIIVITLVILVASATATATTQAQAQQAQEAELGCLSYLGLALVFLVALPLLIAATAAFTKWLKGNKKETPMVIVFVVYNVYYWYLVLVMKTFSIGTLSMKMYIIAMLWSLAALYCHEFVGAWLIKFFSKKEGSSSSGSNGVATPIK